MVCLLVYQDMAERMQGWDAFEKDPEFTKYAPTLPQESVRVSVLKPTRHSPMQ